MLQHEWIYPFGMAVMRAPSFKKQLDR